MNDPIHSITFKSNHQNHPPIPQIKCYYKKKKIPKRHIVLLNNYYYMMKKKKTQGIFNPLYLLLQVEGQRGYTIKEEGNVHYFPQNIGWFCTYKKKKGGGGL